ncbi:hypothetical protein [Thiohalomonas denitrificans]|uniref:hypothetical protein n=1 Tax=Thiohalomonas denitrificans TaxID=415747 RepID=UPI0026F0ADA5|nr:hypothetical protein [Thiohalomonas denitrificans]
MRAHQDFYLHLDGLGYGLNVVDERQIQKLFRRVFDIRWWFPPPAKQLFPPIGVHWQLFEMFCRDGLYSSPALERFYVVFIELIILAIVVGIVWLALRPPRG